MAPYLADLLPQLAHNQQGYDELIVLDDASTDNSREVVRTQGDAWLVAGDENAGPAGNRNRVLPFMAQRGWGEAILHFVDADTAPLTTDHAAQARGIFDDKRVGMAGGLVLNPDGSQMAYNYGPSFTAKSGVGGLAQLRVAEAATSNPDRAAVLRHRLGFLLDAWPDPLHPERPAAPIWVAEGNMLIRSSTLAQIGGFPVLRFHEAQGVGIEVARRGLTALYKPGIAVQHLDGGHHPQRNREMLQASVALIGRYGVARFLFGGDRSV